MDKPPRRRRPTPWRATVGMLRPMRNVLALLVPRDAPLELQIVGRMLLRAALVGAVAGIVGSAFLFALVHVQRGLLEDLCGYVPLRAVGEPHDSDPTGPFRWWLLPLVLLAGGLASGWITRFAPETRGGGGDAAISAFHADNGVIRRRVVWVKAVASIATLGAGGAGGREGPTMQIGAAIGSLVGRYLSLSDRERRTLMVAGIGAGISAVFRTPLGAALLAIEVLYRDDFESEALIPCVLASVVAYSVSLAAFGTRTLFGDLPHFPFHPGQLPLYAGLALVVSVGATAFAHAMRFARRMFARLPGPEWLRPGLGGLALGGFAVALLVAVDPWVGNGHAGLGVLGGGYGGGQLAITGASWIEHGWGTVEILLGLAIAKIVASSLTIGSGGSAGDFAPSIAIGGLLGGAFGAAAQLVFDDPSIQPGAFALVGMAAFYAGIANVPLAALVMVCEVAGSYDLLVPLMLTEAIAMIALRRVNLYETQPRTMPDSPVHAGSLVRLRCREVLDPKRVVVTVSRGDTIEHVANVFDDVLDQDVFPVVDGGAVVGLLSAEAVRAVMSDGDAPAAMTVADVMVKPLLLRDTDTLGHAANALLRRSLRAAPVVDATGKLLGMLDEQDIVRASMAMPASPGESSPRL